MLNYLDEQGYVSAVPRLQEGSVEPEPFVDFTSGYVQRSIHLFPMQGSRPPWRLYQNYVRDRKLIRRAPLEDGVLEFSPGPGSAAHQVPCGTTACGESFPTTSVRDPRGSSRKSCIGPPA